MKDIFVIEQLKDELVPKDFMKSYFTHILCSGGKGQFRLDKKDYYIKKNDIVIFLPNQEIQDLQFSPKFKATFFLVSFDLLSKNNPNIGWGIKGYMFSKENPVVNLERKLQSNAEKTFIY